MTENERITAAVQAIIDDVNTRHKDTVNGLMVPEVFSVDAENQSVTLRFRALPWEANRAGILHGGIIASMMDHVLGISAAAYRGSWTPTLSLNMDYIRPVQIGDTVLATATVLSMGRQVIRLRGEIINEATGKLAASCSATFFSKEA